MMFRKAMLIVALVAASPIAVTAAQQPTQAPAAKSRSDTTKAKAHHRRAHKAKATGAATQRDTTKSKP